MRYLTQGLSEDFTDLRSLTHGVSEDFADLRYPTQGLSEDFTHLSIKRTGYKHVISDIDNCCCMHAICNNEHKQ